MGIKNACHELKCCAYVMRAPIECLLKRQNMLEVPAMKCYNKTVKRGVIM